MAATFRKALRIPRGGSRGFFDLEEARTKINPAQIPLLEEIVRLVSLE